MVHFEVPPRERRRAGRALRGLEASGLHLVVAQSDGAARRPALRGFESNSSAKTALGIVSTLTRMLAIRGLALQHLRQLRVCSMVNRVFVERYLQGRSPLGLHVSGGLDTLVKNRHVFDAAPSRIVGIVGDAREAGPDREPVPTVYTCFSAPHPAPWHLVRTVGDPAAAATVVRQAIRALEPLRSVYEVAPLEARMGDAYSQNRLRTWLLSLFAITALALVCAGVYGTLSYAVSLRRREVALRLALGALRRSLVQQLMATSMRIVGIADRSAAWCSRCIFTRSLSTMLYGVTPADPATLTASSCWSRSVAGIAAVIPATRAAFMSTDARASRGVTHVLASTSHDHVPRVTSRARHRSGARLPPRRTD